LLNTITIEILDKIDVEELIREVEEEVMRLLEQVMNQEEMIIIQEQLIMLEKLEKAEKMKSER